MTEKQKNDFLFIVFIVTVIILAVLYFSIPERSNFIEYQLTWWKEFREVFMGFLN
jgi:hypothetical protein